MNSVYLNGRLAADPVLKSSANGHHYVYFTVANNEKTSKDSPAYTSFIRCIAWGKTAELICRVLNKGSRIWIDSANLIASEYTDKNGTKRYEMKVQVYKFDFVASDTKQKTSVFDSFGENFEEV